MQIYEKKVVSGSERHMYICRCNSHTLSCCHSHIENIGSSASMVHDYYFPDFLSKQLMTYIYIYVYVYAYMTYMTYLYLWDIYIIISYYNIIYIYIFI